MSHNRATTHHLAGRTEAVTVDPQELAQGKLLLSEKVALIS